MSGGGGEPCGRSGGTRGALVGPTYRRTRTTMVAKQSLGHSLAHLPALHHLLECGRAEADGLEQLVRRVAAADDHGQPVGVLEEGLARLHHATADQQHSC